MGIRGVTHSRLWSPAVRGPRHGHARLRHGIERHDLRLVNVTLPVTGLPVALDGLRIGLITDIHHSEVVPRRRRVRRAVALLQDSRPELIVLGDYVSFGDQRYVEPVAELLAPLAEAPYGSFAVPGNHDDDREMPAALHQRGFSVLRDQRTRLEIRGETVDLAGLRFWTTARRPGRILGDTSGTTFLLAHDPRRLTEAAAFDVQLVLSGHTHGGQVLLPGVGAIAGRKFPVLAGTGREGNATLFVSRGVGTV